MSKIPEHKKKKTLRVISIRKVNLFKESLKKNRPRASRQGKAENPTDKLDHLRVPISAAKGSEEWAAQVEYNNKITELSTIKCWYCGCYGHHFEECAWYRKNKKQFAFCFSRKVVFNNLMARLLKNE